MVVEKDSTCNAWIMYAGMLEMVAYWVTWDEEESGGLFPSFDGGFSDFLNCSCFYIDRPI